MSLLVVDQNNKSKPDSEPIVSHLTFVDNQLDFGVFEFAKIDGDQITHTKLNRGELYESSSKCRERHNEDFFFWFELYLYLGDVYITLAYYALGESDLVQ